MFDMPAFENAFGRKFAEPLMKSYQRLLKRSLVGEGATPKDLYHAPFPVMAHDAGRERRMCYGNLAAQALLKLDWASLIEMESQDSTSPEHRIAREAMFDQMRVAGFIDYYTGVRRTAAGEEFEVRNATIWQVSTPNGLVVAEAVAFSEYSFL